MVHWSHGVPYDGSGDERVAACYDAADEGALQQPGRHRRHQTLPWRPSVRDGVVQASHPLKLTIASCSGLSYAKIV